VLDALIQLRSDGMILGLTVSGPRQADVIRRALAIDADGVNPFQVVQATWNLLEISAAPALADAKSHGWGVIVKEALANGRLATGDAETKDIVNRARRLGTTLDRLALAAALAQPWADVVLSGAVTTAQLTANLSALELNAVPEDLLSLAVPPEEYWNRRKALRWE
jgi:aryl-alcohol dehydrogenase-like predicted oxidoreductase